MLKRVEQVHVAAAMILLCTAEQREGGSRESDDQLLDCVVAKCKRAACAVVSEGNADPQRAQGFETASANFWACALLQQAVCDANGGEWKFSVGHNVEWVAWDALKASVENLEGTPSHVPSEWQVDFRARPALSTASGGDKRRRHAAQPRTICKHGFGRYAQQLKKMELLHAMLVIGGEDQGLHEAIRQLRPPQLRAAQLRTPVRLGGGARR
jgi:hypothetical protein